MLVLSRRPDEGIRFPELDIFIQVLKSNRGQIRLGIDAPASIKVIRDEIDYEVSMDSLNRALDGLPREVRHDLRNQLNAVLMAVTIIEKHLEKGNTEAADQAVAMLRQQVKELCLHSALMSGQEEPSSADAMPADQTTEVTTAADDSRNAVVLVVEDCENERELLAGLLRLFGVNVATATNGQEALEWLRTHQNPAYVLTDMRMDGGDGASLVRQIRSDHRFDKVRVFGVSGSDFKDTGLKSGEVDAWFQKPVNIDCLVDEFRRKTLIAS